MTLPVGKGILLMYAFSNRLDYYLIRYLSNSYPEKPEILFRLDFDVRHKSN